MDELWQLAKAAIRAAMGMEYHGPRMNERYVHHFISHYIQTAQAVLDLEGPTADLLLHPEWPTSKRSTNLAFGRYRKRGRQYMPTDDGSAGFIDFALGDYERPGIAIELTLKCNGWSNEEVVYDLLKLLDARNPFTQVISFNAILRPQGISTGGRQQRLQQRMLDAYDEALARLGDGGDPSRQKIVVVSEIGPTNRRHWYLDDGQQDFLEAADVPPPLHD